MTREEVQKEAVEALIKNNGGTIVLDTGTGKTKVAIDFIMRMEISDILILVPRIVLQETWVLELTKWGIKKYGIKDYRNNTYYYIDTEGHTQLITIKISTIQKEFKTINRYEDYLIIADEIHSMFSEQYSQFFYKNPFNCFIGLTATPEDYKVEKKKVYNDIAPIVYTYKKAAEDNIINGRKYFVLRTDLDNTKKTIDGWKYSISELEVLNFYNRRMEQAGERIQEYFNRVGMFNGNYFSSASKWCWQGRGDNEQKKLGWPYLKAMSDRKAFMLNQNTTTDLVKNLVHTNFNSLYPYINDGILIFSNQISQAQKILNDEYIVHSKKKKDENEKIIYGFDEKVFNIIGSCESLGMGLNFKRAKVAIFESYVGSHTKASQKMGRTDRLPIDENAVIVIIYINNSPCEGWYRKSGFPNFEDENTTVFTNPIKLIEALNDNAKS